MAYRDIRGFIISPKQYVDQMSKMSRPPFKTKVPTSGIYAGQYTAFDWGNSPEATPATDPMSIDESQITTQVRDGLALKVQKYIQAQQKFRGEATIMEQILENQKKTNMISNLMLQNQAKQEALRNIRNEVSGLTPDMAEQLGMSRSPFNASNPFAQSHNDNVGLVQEQFGTDYGGQAQYENASGGSRKEQEEFADEVVSQMRASRQPPASGMGIQREDMDSITDFITTSLASGGIEQDLSFNEDLARALRIFDTEREIATGSQLERKSGDPRDFDPSTLSFGGDLSAYKKLTGAPPISPKMQEFITTFMDYVRQGWIMPEFVYRRLTPQLQSMLGGIIAGQLEAETRRLPRVEQGIASQMVQEEAEELGLAKPKRRRRRRTGKASN